MTRQELGRKVDEYGVKRAGRSRRSKILSVLSSLVVFCITYALILPALTWERARICELQEHTHSDSCYAEVEIPETELVKCGMEEHRHIEACYTSDGQLICTMAEHTHTAQCREVIPAHTERVLTCTLEEHIHTDDCFDAPPAEAEDAFCGYAEHQHTEACYTSDGQLICTMTEHTHTAQCFSDPEADLETAEIWEASFADVALTGNWGADVLAIAQSQLGVRESERNYLVDDDGTVNGYTRYGAWYGLPYADWCAIFCSFCLHYAGVDTTVFPQEASCPRWIELLSSEDYDLYRPAEGYLPKPGDLIFFDYDSYTDVSEREANHVGFVCELLEDENGDVTKIKTIEGNTNAGVASNTYEITDDSILGYAELPQCPALRAAKKAASAEVGSGIIECWQEVTSIDDAGTDYLIVSAGGYALGVDASHKVTSAPAELTQVSGYDGYYTTDLSSAFYWVFSATGATSTQTNVSYNEYGLRLNNITIIDNTKYQTKNTLSYSSSGKYWRIKYSNYYLSCNTSGTFSRATSTSNANMKIYKAAQIVKESSPAVEDIVVKPDYPDYLSVSPAETGDTTISEVSGTYYSDAATSQLESQFTGVASDDGKVLADKSVIYGGDDYGAFESYDSNTFGITLSALGQKYSVTQELEVRVPLDVVFVLDTSGSMINSKYNGVTSANIMIESLNKIMKDVMDANKDNRVGVVCYSGAATKLLDLGRYTATNDKYFPEGKCTSNTYQLAPSTSIRRTDGTLYKGTFSGGWYGTFTQDGIAMGAQEFFDTEDTTITRTVTKETADGVVQATYTVKRRPVLLLLSDGEPTYCTPDYANVLGCKRVYGDGTTGYDNNSNLPSIDDLNNKGVLGYYTILTAKNYKDRIAKHYGTDVFFYTIGIGINSEGVNSFANSIAADDYKRAVLNPTETNVNAIRNCTNGISEGASKNKNISSLSDVTCHMLYRLLHNAQPGSSVTLKRHTYQVYGIRTSDTLATVPIIQNPYINIGYDYTDGAFFTANNSVDTLTKAFEDAINYNDTFPVYGFNLRDNLPVTVSDTIGDGMELKSEPVLRYGGVNHTPVSHETVGNVTTYHYAGIWTAEDGSDQTADLSQITAVVTTDENGRQTVTMTVPDNLLPTYTPNLKNDGSASFYYEVLPVRLIYQVGLTEKAVADVKALALTGGIKTFYTNCWSEDDFASSGFTSTAFNPYYNAGNYDKSPLPKDDNTTQTQESAQQYIDEANPAFIHTRLGNNGKLVFAADVVTADIKLVKVNQDDQPILSDTAKFTLYQDADRTVVLGEYETDNAEIEITGLAIGTTYYLEETKAPNGFNPMPGVKEIVISADGKVVVPDDEEFFRFFDDNVIHIVNRTGYALPETGGTGTYGIYTIGILLAAVAALCGIRVKRKRERRQNT
mgnify:CR=1 FL=1